MSKSIFDMGYRFVEVLPYSGVELFRQKETDKWGVIFLDPRNDNRRTLIQFIEEDEARQFANKLEERAFIRSKNLFGEGVLNV